MDYIDVWLAYIGMAYDKSGMGGCRDVCYLGDTASFSYSDYIRISEIGK